MITIKVNSADRHLESSCLLSEFMDGEGLGDKGGVAVAINGRIVRKPQWSTRMIEEGDDIIIINAAYGG